MHEAYKKLVGKVKTFAQEKASQQELLEELRSKAQEHSRFRCKCSHRLKLHCRLLIRSQATSALLFSS